MAHHAHLPLVRDSPPRPSLAFGRAPHPPSPHKTSPSVMRPPTCRPDVAVRPEWRTLPSGTTPPRDADVMETLQQQLNAFTPPSPSPTPRRQLRELQRQQQQLDQAERQQGALAQQQQQQVQVQRVQVVGTAEDLLEAVNKAAVEGPSSKAWLLLAALAGDDALLQRARDLLPAFKFQETIRNLWSLGQLADHLRTAPPSAATPAALRALPAALAPALVRALTTHHLRDTSSFRWHADRYLLLAGALDGLHRITSYCAAPQPPPAPTPAPTTPAPPSPVARRIDFTAPSPRPRHARSQSPTSTPAAAAPSGPPPPATSRRAAISAAAAATTAASSPAPPSPPTTTATQGAVPDAVRQASSELQAAICTAAAEELRRPAMTDACVGQLADLLEAISRSAAGRSCGAGRPLPSTPIPGAANKAAVALVQAADAARAHMQQEHGRYSVAFAGAALRIITAASGSAAPSSPLLAMARGVAQTAAVQVALAHERQEASAEEESAALVQLLRGFLQLGFWPGEALMQAASARLWLHMQRLPAPLLASALATFATFNYRPCSSFLTAARRRLAALRGALPLEQEATLEAHLTTLSGGASPAPALSPAMTVAVPAAAGAAAAPQAAVRVSGSMLRQHLLRAAEAPLQGQHRQHCAAAVSGQGTVGAEARRVLMSAL